MSMPSRRAVLRTAAAGAAAAGAGVAAVKLAGSGGRAQPGHGGAAARTVHRRTVAENSLPGDPHWWIRKTGAPDAVMGYASQASVLPGQLVRLYVSTTSREFRVRAFRMGWYGGDLARQVWESGPVRAHRQRAAALTAETNTVHADWGVSLTVHTAGWPAGCYLLRLDAHSGAQRYVPLTVRSARTAGRAVLKNCVATWQAYNTWGGYDLYKGPDGSYASRALAVSMDRPYDEQGAYLFEVYERKLINLAERMGLPLAYLTSMDIAADPHALDGASALVSLGHDEYWSPPERAHVTAARDAGVNLAFLGANAMFRKTRLARTPLGRDRLVICYKTSYQQDPMYGVDNALVTKDWREPPDPDPESAVIGTLYEGYPTVADYVVAQPGAWMLAGTGARQGTSFAALVGIEYDRVNPGYPVQRPIQIARPFPADLQRREQLRRHRLLHPPQRRRGIQRRHHALGGILRAAHLRMGHHPGLRAVHPPGHRQRAAGVCRRAGRRPVSGARQPGRDARMARRPARGPARPVAPGDLVSAPAQVNPRVNSPGRGTRSVRRESYAVKAPPYFGGNSMRQPRKVSRMTRWAVPAGAVATVGLVAAGTVLSGAQATPQLPARTSAQLLASVLRAADSAPRPMTATVSESAALGLPSLPDVGGVSASLSGLTSPHTFRVWYADPSHVRVAVLASMGETDLRVAGRQVWLWRSSSQTATHLVLPAKSARAEARAAGRSAAAAMTPQQAARKALAAVGPSTVVGVRQNLTVAGQAAYQLRIAPRTSQSLVGQIRIAIDAANSMPLQLQVFARGASSPAIQIGFTSITWGKPAAANFTFTPPKGAKVRQASLPAPASFRLGIPFPALLPGAFRQNWVGRELPANAAPAAAGKGARLPAGLHVITIGNGRRIVVPKNLPPAALAKLKAALKDGRFPAPVAVKGHGFWVGFAGLPKGAKLPAQVPVSAAARPRVIGTGWLSVAVFPAGPGLSALLTHPGVPATMPRGSATYGGASRAAAQKTVPVRQPAPIAAGPLGQYLPLLEKAATPVHGAWGSGRLLQTALVSVLITSKGEVLAGAVTPSVLYAAAAQAK